ncbi:integral membrane protein [Streptomyces clavuligerus]|nr:integral membrane protein [Streptomyces clavuligerus]
MCARTMRRPYPPYRRSRRRTEHPEEGPVVLHLRLITPADRTAEVIELIEQTVGTTHLAVVPGAALDPRGDVVMCDVAREAGDQLISGLRKLGIDECGSIAVEDIGFQLSTRAHQAEKDAPGEAADAVLWERLEGETREESTLSVTYVAFMTLATMIAACGVVLDNAILIVGAMAVGPEFGPLAGVCAALVQRAPRLAWRSSLALIVGFAVAMAATVGFSHLMELMDLFHPSDLEAERPNTDFIYQPDAFSFVVAILAGIAGMLSLTSSRSGALVGVAISVTTIPAAANAAVAFSFQEYRQAWGSTEQLLLNLLGIVIAGTLTRGLM